MPYSPLGRGFLTGQIQSPRDFEAGDHRKSQPRFQEENFQKNLDLVERIKQMATEKGWQPSQLALGWLLAQGKDVVPIPGTKRRKYLEENVAAASMEVTSADLARINEIAPQGITAGARYPEHSMNSVNR